MIRVFLGLSGLNIEKFVKLSKNKRILARRSSASQEIHLISHHTGGFMGDPQPRGFRQAPLKPSDIFWVGSDKPTFGRTSAVSHTESNAKSNRQLPDGRVYRPYPQRVGT